MQHSNLSFLGFQLFFHNLLRRNDGHESTKMERRAEKRRIRKERDKEEKQERKKEFRHLTTDIPTRNIYFGTAFSQED
jgi:hypothetical protein